MTDVVSKPIVADVDSLDSEAWTERNGVPIADEVKKEWIRRAIEWLKNNPNEYSYQISSGDTMIQVRKQHGSNFYSVNEFTPQRYVLIHRDGHENDPCVCDLATLNSSGCECGGN